MNTLESSSGRRFRPGRRGMRLLLAAAGTLAIASTAVGGPLAAAATQSPARPAATPVRDIVGAGLITCRTATGEVGYSPASRTGATGLVTVSIWFQASRCSAAASATTPVPRTVIGAISFTRRNGCPLLSPPALGTGVLNLTYNYPGVPSVMIDPSVGQRVTVTESAPFWVLKGTLGGSYPSTTFQAWLQPVVFGGQSCRTGITSEYIVRAGAPFIFRI